LAERLSTGRKIIKLFHPEGIPGPGALFYNALSKTKSFQKFYEMVAKDIIDHCDRGSILDIGTGPGWLLLKLNALSSDLQITGSDISPTMVDRARQNLAAAGLQDRIAVVQNEGNHLPFADNTFEIVVSTGSIHHWKKPEVMLNDCYRVLKQGGCALMYDIVSDPPTEARKEISREFGSLNALLLGIHALEEPFYTLSGFESLAGATLFGKGSTHFVGPMCCLELRK